MIAAYVLLYSMASFLWSVNNKLLISNWKSMKYEVRSMVNMPNCAFHMQAIFCMSPKYSLRADAPRPIGTWGTNS